MSAWPEPDALRALQRAAEGHATQVGLPLDPGRHGIGSVLGRTSGASVEYQDHRPFVLGDDPRHLDWAAYARSGRFVAKVYRAEVALEVDLAFDLSRSMAVLADKQRRALELFYLVLAAARRLAASVRIFGLLGDAASRVPVEAVDAGAWLPEAAPQDRPQVPALQGVPWRSGALRVLVSDLLFPGAPSSVLATLGARAGRAVVLAPAAAAEGAPDWQGRLTFVDAETGEATPRTVDAETQARFRAAYRAHFDGYRDAGRRLGVGVAQVPAEPAFLEALAREAVPAEVVGPCR